MEFNTILPFILPYFINAVVIGILVSEIRKQLEQFSKIKNSKLYNERLLQLLPYFISAIVQYCIVKNIYLLDYKTIVISAMLSGWFYRIIKKLLNKKTIEIEDQIDKAG